MSSIALKLTSLLIRTVSKPIANGLKAQAKQHATFRKVCIDMAQFLHRTDMRLRMGLLGEKNLRVRPLNDAKAIDSGANFLSETFIFSVAGGLILFESIRSRRKEMQRRETVADDIRTLQDEIEWLRNVLKAKKVIEEDYKLPQDVKPAILSLKDDGTSAPAGTLAPSVQTDGTKTSDASAPAVTAVKASPVPEATKPTMAKN
uniref:ARAD1C32912p n=1 Tax=Blastobotrys adeninivorans TaxID=409370 RepID=A0A060T3F7_BLAAD